MASHDPAHLPALDAYADLEDVDNAAHALCLIMSAFRTDEYTNLEPCRSVLERHEDLRDMLKDCYATRNFDTLWTHVALRQQVSSLNTAEIMKKLRAALVDLLN
ncbi:hypothetical protein B0H15DRAFT_956665 [Mycena belliarum]|uniref:Uncharacterized protein n=1 Tax=Mycena belliarum TaxID=1033014 RepID=A0AAD6XMA9_9AGAR|nr:hypothetical protein B0H15DRAFT_956665 [Mycena belliae]